MAPAPAKGRPRGDLFEGFNNLNLLRQAGLMVGLAASVAIGFAVVLWTQGEDYRPLYASLDRVDSSEVFEILEQSRIDYKIDVSSGALLVPANDLHIARLRLAEVGLPGQRSHGFELMDQDQPLGTSQFVESTRYHRSIEGELARTITSINTIRSARVHLAIPKRSVFVRDARKPKASVFVEVFPGRTVEQAQVAAIVNLVASSIAELVPEEVTVVDQRGNLLSKIENDENLILADRQRAFTRRVEDQITDRVNGILEPILGANRYRAEVSADVDFTAVEQAAETFNPELAVLRSEQVLNEAREGADIGVGIPGALTNQPPGTAEAPEAIDPETGQPVAGARPSNRREQATRNFELDRTISYTRHQQGRIQRLSVAVVVDDKIVLNEEGQEQREPWTEVEIERMETLVRDAVGFSAARGDSVNVLNSPFRVSDIESFELPEIPWWQEDWVLSYLKQGAGVLVILVLIFGLLRPVLKSLARTGGRISEEQEAQELAALEAAGLGGYGASPGATVTLTGGALGLPGPEEGYEQQLNAIKGLVADDPGRVAQVVKAWINKDD